jgi:hypothetical protein
MKAWAQLSAKIADSYWQLLTFWSRSIGPRPRISFNSAEERLLSAFFVLWTNRESSSL